MDDRVYQQKVKQYALHELFDIVEHIDQKQFPERYRMVVEEIHQRQTELAGAHHISGRISGDRETAKTTTNQIQEQAVEENTINAPWTLSRRITCNDLRPIWRIIVAIVLAQLVGGGVGLCIHFHHFPFYNLWYGAALSMPVGFFIGLVWYLRHRPLRMPVPTTLIGFIGFLVMSIAVMGGVFLPRLLKEMRLLQETQQLQAAAIHRIVLTDADHPPAVTVDQQAEIQTFVTAVHDAQGYAPNHDLAIREWFVRIDGETSYEYRCYITEKLSHDVVCSFIQRQGNSTAFYGDFSSRGLRTWFARSFLSSTYQEEKNN